MIRRLIMAWLLACLWSTSAAAATVQATVDRSEITLDDRLVLTVSVEGGGGEVDVSPIDDFQVISRGSRTNVSIVNGRMSKTISRVYDLVPKREGRLVIPPLPVQVGRDVLMTREIQITVAQSRPGRDSGRDVFMEASVSSSTPYLGEALIYKLKIHRAVEIANAGLDNLEFPGFTAKQSSEQKGYQTVINGRRYMVTELVFILTPLKTGENQVGPAVLHFDVIRRGRRGRSPLDRFFMDDPFFSRTDLEPRICRTEALTVQVRPLPAYEGPDAFSGLVGQFELTAELEKSTIRVRESATLVVTVQGHGNVMDAAEPEWPAPSGFKVYRDAPEDEITLDEKGYHGKKVFRLALVALAEGDCQIPPISLTYFDPKRQQYVTERSGAFKLRVLPAAREETPLVVSPSTRESDRTVVDKQKVEFLHKDILPLRDDLSALENRRPMTPFLFFLLFGLPMVLLAIGAIVLKVFRQELGVSKRMAIRAEEILKAASGRASQAEILSDCMKALTAAVYSRVKRQGESLTYEEAEELLRSNEASPDEAVQIRAFMERIDHALYGGLSLDRTELEATVQETRQWVSRLCR